MKIHTLLSVSFGVITVVFAVAFFIARDNQKDLVEQNQQLFKELTVHENAASDARSFLRWYSLNQLDESSVSKDVLDANIKTLKSNYAHYYPEQYKVSKEQTDVAWENKSQ